MGTIGVVFICINDTLKTTATLNNTKYYLHEGKICNWDNFNILLTEIDTSTGLITNQDTLVSNVYYHDVGFPVSGDNICFKKNDSLYVYSLQTRENILSYYISSSNFSNQEPILLIQHLFIYTTFI